MITKLNVIVREVYESEEKEMVWSNSGNGEIISDYDYRNEITAEDKKNYVRKEIPTGKMKITPNETPLYSQNFDNLNVADLCLYLNRIK